MRAVRRMTSADHELSVDWVKAHVLDDLKQEDIDAMDPMVRWLSWGNSAADVRHSKRSTCSPEP